MILKNIHSKLVTRRSWLLSYAVSDIDSWWIEKDKIDKNDNDDGWLPWCEIEDLFKENLNIKYDIIRNIYIVNDVEINPSKNYYSQDFLHKLMFNILDSISKEQPLINMRELLLYKYYNDELNFVPFNMV